MLFRSLTLNDFGTYAGVNEIELTTTPDRPIVLVGGTNGAGKTTILEAVLLCLHGRRALGDSVSLREYQSHLSSRIHRPPGDTGPPGAASVALRFDHVEAGALHDYRVERTWSSTSSVSIREDLKLWRDSELVDDLPKSAWQDFLDGLVPPGVAGLFFFDGERIQALAEDETGARLSEAIRRLLGLDVVDQLGRDLTRYIAKHGTAKADVGVSRLADAHQQQAAAEARIEALKVERAALMRRRDVLSERATKNREVFARLGGTLALERDKLEAQHARALAQANDAAVEVRALIAGLLPFAIAPEIARRVEARIGREEKAEERSVVRARVASSRDQLDQVLLAEGDASAAETVEQILLETDGRPTHDDPETVHDLTSSERALLASQVAQVSGSVPPAALKSAKALRKADEVRTRTLDLLNKVPDQTDISDVLVALQEAERELAAVDVELAELDRAAQQALYEERVSSREVRRATDEAMESGQISERVAHAVRTNAVLEEFGRRTQAAKLGRIEEGTARFFNRLSGKGEFLKKVDIDPTTFRMSVQRWDGADLPKERLSAGEKQLLAIALLWALAKVSERPLPVIIDTPLARLDNAHREKLLREYFPNVSHQVVILSTDSEVTAPAAEALHAFTSRAFHLEHEAEACRTAITPGYFPEPSAALNAR